MYVEKLLSVDTKTICHNQPILNASYTMFGDSSVNELQKLLEKKNGIYAFESALHIFPSNCSNEIDLETWNRPDCWKEEYDADLEEYLFFAEDAFGGQFAISNNVIFRFDPETGELEHFANSIEEWASKILEDYDFETGYSLASEWQKINRPLKKGERLLPKIPFVLGGEYNIENLYASDAVEGMRFRASIARQIRDLPDGAQVKLEIVNNAKNQQNE